MSTANDRLLSLDVFRGITIAAMILVNNPGSWSFVYAPLRHAAWHGWTPTDLIFPFFLFIVGVSMTLSFRKVRERGTGLLGLYGKIVRRALLLFAFGLFLNAFPIDIGDPATFWQRRLETLRIPGVLQRIALVYLIASPFALHLRWKGVLTAAFACLVAYTAAMAFVPFDVVQDGLTTTHRGTLEEGLSLAAWVDHAWLAGHTYRPPNPLSFDPEGLLSTVPAIATTLAGVLTGLWFRHTKDAHQRAVGLFHVGVWCTFAGLVLDALVPINKPLWTASYVVFTAGLALLVLGVTYVLLDVQRWRFWAHPFVVFGRNAIALYMLAGILARTLLLIRVGPGDERLKTWVFEHALAPWLPSHVASLSYAVAMLCALYAAMAWLHRRGIFLKV
ncbi:MAG: DUF1624 domain-containing protein [Planctomycetes bacterium]|nr:DUF1624 domain-containing protein [Planctomycetota bacterium]MCB9891825.1 DUF1624 domain-containing protein [Planctomycetota bacterium]